MTLHYYNITDTGTNTASRADAPLVMGACLVNLYLCFLLINSGNAYLSSFEKCLNIYKGDPSLTPLEARAKNSFLN